MKAVQFYSPYGYRARNGVIIPGVNVNMESEFYRVAPKGVSIHTSRMMLLGKATQESTCGWRAIPNVRQPSLRRPRWTSSPGPAHRAACCSRQQDRGDDCAIAGCPAISALTSVIAALKAFGAERVALGTPYVSFINETEMKCWKRPASRWCRCTALNLAKPERSAAESRAFRRNRSVIASHGTSIALTPTPFSSVAPTSPPSRKSPPSKRLVPNRLSPATSPPFGTHCVLPHFRIGLEGFGRLLTNTETPQQMLRQLANR